jgi:hypothetical protein
MVRRGIHRKLTCIAACLALFVTPGLWGQTSSVSILVNGAKVTATNPLPTTGGGAGGSGATGTDRTAFTSGTSVFAPAGGVWNDAMADLTAGMWATVRMTKQRAFHVNLRDATGAEISPALESGNLATIVTNTGRIPASPATDRTTAAAPFAMRLSDGAAFLDPRDVSDRSARLLGHTVTDSGSVTSATIATDSVGLAKDSTLTAGSQKAIARGAAKGTTAAADLTGEPVDANTQALHVFVKNAALAVTGTFFQVTQPVSIAATVGVNLAQVAGATVATGNGTAAGAQRVTLASDSTGQEKALLNDGAGNPIGSGGTGTGLTVAGTEDGATGSAPPAKASYSGANSSGVLTGIIQCDKFAQAAIATATNTQLVALSGVTKVYVCSYAIEIQGVVTTAGTGKLVYGTGTACATGLTNITPDFIGNVTAGVPTVISLGSGIGPVAITPAGQALCYTSTTTTVQKVFVSYTQF